MATIHIERTINRDPDAVWGALSDFGAVHIRVAPDFLVDAHLEAPDRRVVSFRNGLVATEVLVTSDATARRLVYSARTPQLTHHNASAHALPNGDGTTRFAWTADILPDNLAETVRGMMEEGADAVKATLEATANVHE